ncbi:MAG: hypothetical protein JNL80_10205 [Phycisphaerae bacterium]|nr:hypothetical protein [Phycisphaerae bacterium]
MLHASLAAAMTLSVHSQAAPPAGGSEEAAPPPQRLVIRADAPGHAIPDSLWGIFFEEINHAGEGGLLAEKLRNRSFAEPIPENREGIPGWTRRDGSILEAAPPRYGDVMSTVRLHGGMHNEGYFRGERGGISVRGGETYAVRVDAKRMGEASITVALESSDGTRLAHATLAPLTDEWQSLLASLEPSATADGARFSITTNGPGDALIDLVSLTPKSTWRGHGLRHDLAELVAAMKPAFLRFPGGCYVEGGDFLKDAFRWPATVGDVASRPGHMNATWGYWSSDGLGFHEYLQWCEDLGAEPLFVVNCGLSHKESVPMDLLGPWVQEALDALDYANGPQSSEQGAKRANNGHPAPFGLRLIEIGNENGMFGSFGGTAEQYLERYRVFAEAIRAKHPDVRIISNIRVSGPNTPQPDFVDEHFYNTPGWFWQNVGLYDRADRTGLGDGTTPAIYVGEYAVTQGCGLGNLDAALAEAAFMTGIERNSDLVRMASYAPLFVHTLDRRWNPDAIVFDASRSYGTPSYWVQALFADHRADRLLPLELPSLALVQPSGTVGLGTWQTQAEFKDIRVTFGETTVEPSAQDGMRPVRGAWSWEQGTYRIREEADERLVLLDVPALHGLSDYTLSLKAKKLAGAEGFLIAFHADRSSPDGERLTWWNIGGWGNTTHAIERTDGGRVRLGAGVPGQIETDRWYDIRVECAAGRVRCFLDGTLIHDLDARLAPRVAGCAGVQEQSGEFILKLVNGTSDPLTLVVDVSGVERIQRAESIVLSGASLADENTFEEPFRIAPKRTTFSPGPARFPYTFPARSLTVLRVTPAAAK